MPYTWCLFIKRTMTLVAERISSWVWADQAPRSAGHSLPRNASHVTASSTKPVGTPSRSSQSASAASAVTACLQVRRLVQSLVVVLIVFVRCVALCISATVW